jgi:hypothetical protein
MTIVRTMTKGFAHIAAIGLFVSTIAIWSAIACGA